MARIAFFIERLPPHDDPVAGFAYDLMRSLADLGHEIRVFATYSEGAELPPAHPRIAIIRPFRTWGWLEIPRLMPLLMEFRPDVLHLIQPGDETRRAMSLLPGMSRLLGRPAIVSSLYDFIDRDLKANRWLLLSSNTVTVSNEPQRQLVETYFKDKLSQLTFNLLTLPIPISRRFSSEPTSLSGTIQTFDDSPVINEALSDFLTAAFENALVFIPGDISEHRDPEALFVAISDFLQAQPEALAVFGGGWGRTPKLSRLKLMRIFDSGGVGARVLLTGPLNSTLNSESERLCLTRARVVFLASLALESLGLTRILREALDVGALLIMNETQANADALNWQHDENSLIVDSNPATWSAAIDRALSTPHLVDGIRARLPEFGRSEAVDHPGNVMSRIYAQILSNKF